MKKLSLFVVVLFTSFILLSCDSNEVKKHIVEFNTDGGSYIASEEVTSGGKATRPEVDPNKKDYVFDNWYKEANTVELFDFETVITEDTVIYAKWDLNDKVEEQVTVIFNSNGGTEVLSSKVNKGDKVLKPNNPSKSNYIFAGWYKESTLINKYDFNSIVDKDITLYAKWEEVDLVNTYEVRIHGGSINGEKQFYFKNNEEFKLGTPTHELSYVFIGWYIDENLTIEFVAPKFLIDDLDLYAKFDKGNIKEQFDSGSYQESLWALYSGNAEVQKVEYKQSLKSTWLSVDKELIRKDKNTYQIDIVGLTSGYYDIKITTDDEELLSEHIFVDELDRSGYAHFKYDEGIGAYNNDGTLKEDAIVIYVTEENKDSIVIPGVGQVGLGWILNNAQYSSNDKPSYDLEAYNKSLAKFDKPIVFRLIGTITTPEGATIFNSLENGGSKGDNGHMVRMRDAKNITIEGIGDDAVILGWGMHFMAASKDRGYGFEVRNITFDKYPEDAVGIEGVQSGGVLTNPVERGWIHNNTFLEGYCANPAESDKGAGDGSLDIKRGQYFTISYNQFLETKKTNLVGASDSNMQYHITYHHNHWRNVDSRVPLSRQANIHMYNNLFETTDDNKGQNSYVQNTRANAYIYSEANYFNASKAPSRVDSGAIKSFGDVKYSTYDRDEAIVVKTRDEKVTSGNKFENFDTDSNVFYYDSVNKRSNVKRLTDAVTARLEVYAYSGVNKKVAKTNQDLLKVTNEKATLIDETLELGVTKINKGKPFLVFEVNKQATVEMISNNKVPAVLVDIYGRRFITGSGSVIIEPGIYVIESSISHGASKGSSQAKDSGFDKLKITIDDTTDEEKIAYVNSLIELIPSSIAYNKSHYSLIDNAINAYNQLDKSLQTQVDITKALNALSTYNNLGKDHIEALINNIGTVTTESGNKIAAARSAYNDATKEIRNMISNYDVLVTAEAEFEDFKVAYINSAIEDLFTLSDISNLTLDEVLEYLIDYNEVYELYLGLDEEQVKDILDIGKVINGIDLLEDAELAYELDKLITEFDLKNETFDNYNLIKDIYDQYHSLNQQVQVFVSETNKAKLDVMYEMYLEYKNTTTVQFFHYNGNNPFFGKGSGKFSKFDMKPAYVYEGLEINHGLKLESSTELTFTSDKTMHIYIQLFNANAININGSEYTPNSDNVIELTLNAGDVSIKKAKDEGRIIYMNVTEIAN